ncbi:MAG: Hsp20/alpha crystallin family protein [Halanaeroarchaeum sp.]
MARRNPFDDIDRLFDRLNRQLETAADRWEDESAFGGDFAVDVEDAGDEFVVTVDLPGFEKDAVDVRVKDRTLTIEADRETASESDPDSNYIRRERHTQSVSRHVTLPETVDTDDVSATMKNGVLTVTLGKLEGGGGRSIDVE